MNKAYIVSAVRTPIGSFGGILSGFSAVQLGTFAMKGAMEKSGVNPDQINEVFFGNVCQANLGQAPSRQAAIAAGIPYNVPCTTVNKVCSSGMKSVMLGAQSIMLGAVDIVMAGGMESMSNIPYYLPKVRWGMKYGGGELVDGLEKDGLRDAYDQGAMGIFADRTAEKYGVSREEQDEFAIQSYKRAAHATEQGWFKNEIIGVEVPQRKKDPIMVTEDEEFKKVRFDKIPNLRPAFTKDGTVTAANASTINDGGSAIIVASEKAVKELGLTPIAEIVSFADAAHEPEWFTTAPTLAAPRAIKAAGMTPQDVDLYEVNEAFSVVPIVFNKELGLKDDKVNIHGGGVSLGHPLGASGARIITTLIHAMDKEGKESGCATLCNGGGGASAIILKKV
ncbi:MAG: thiolase family protein [Saprospiraceae bacterium]|nr:thiolase family protein [Saprospiraceae bacterium]